MPTSLGELSERTDWHETKGLAHQLAPPGRGVSSLGGQAPTSEQLDLRAAGNRRPPCPEYLIMPLINSTLAPISQNTSSRLPRSARPPRREHQAVGPPEPREDSGYLEYLPEVGGAFLAIWCHVRDIPGSRPPADSELRILRGNAGKGSRGSSEWSVDDRDPPPDAPGTRSSTDHLTYQMEYVTGWSLPDGTQ
jgi:hypothetical protein